MYIPIHIHVHIHICVHIIWYMCIYTCMYTYIYIYIYIHVHIHVYSVSPVAFVDFSVCMIRTELTTQCESYKQKKKMLS